MQLGLFKTVLSAEKKMLHASTILSIASMNWACTSNWEVERLSREEKGREGKRVAKLNALEQTAGHSKQRHTSPLMQNGVGLFNVRDF